jgi:hypothetical protein
MKGSATIHAGACGQITKATADFDEKTGLCKLHIETDCPHFAKVADTLEGVQVKPGEEFAWETSQVHKAMRAHCTHTACPVPAGIVKAIQVATGKKSPAQASITTEKL